MQRSAAQPVPASLELQHGEQGALVCTAKIVQQVPSIDAKFYGATQVVDEARHVEAYSRLLHDKFELAYPLTPTFARPIDGALRDARWDMTYLGMPVLIEGLALASFALIRDQWRNRLAASVNAYVIRPEPRERHHRVASLPAVPLRVGGNGPRWTAELTPIDGRIVRVE